MKSRQPTNTQPEDTAPLPPEVTVVVVTSNGYWGKGENLAKALDNANADLSNADLRIIIRAYSCAKESISISDGYAGPYINYPKGATSILVYEGPAKFLIRPSYILGGAARIAEDINRSMMADKLHDLSDEFAEREDAAAKLDKEEQPVKK